jgi:hypothetical protein
MTPVIVMLGAIGVGDQLEVAQDPPQPGRIQPTGCFQQDRFGLGGHMLGEVLGALGQHPGMGGSDVPVR